MKRHFFHLVNPSPWPFVVSLGLLLITSGLAFYMHRVYLGGFVLVLGLFAVMLAAFFWLRDVVGEVSYVGYHTLVVKKGLVFGFLLFIVSEVMLFFGFFWAFFHSSLSPPVEFSFILGFLSKVGLFFIKLPFTVFLIFFLLWNVLYIIYCGGARLWEDALDRLGFFFWRYRLAFCFFSNIFSSLVSFYIVGTPEAGGSEVSLLCELDPRLHSMWRIDREFMRNRLPFYADMHKWPSFDVPKSIDLEGLVDVHASRGQERVERIVFYRFLEYGVVHVSTHFLYDDPFVSPDVFIRNLVFRTLVEYRDLDWQCYDVKLIHRRLAQLNEELICLLVDLCAVEREFRKFIVKKDISFMYLRHSVYAELAGLKPIDYAWGRFTSLGLQELSLLS
jgi:hypothetical protein